MTDGKRVVRVVIPTTEGPATICDLRAEPEQLGQAVATIAGGTREASLSDAYDRLVAEPDGPIDRMTRHRSWRLDLSRDIEAGSSWQAGVVLAHALHREGRLATRTQTADTTLWITGALNGQAIEPADHLGLKLERSLPMLSAARAAGSAVLVVAARHHDAGQWDEFQTLLDGNGLDLAPAPTVDAVARLLDVSCAPLPSPRRRWSWPEVVSSIAVATMGLVGLMTFHEDLLRLWLAWQGPATGLKSFKSCPQCPVMIALPRGRFTMGSPDSEPKHRPTEGPVRPVELGHRFALGKYEITIEQYAVFVEETHRDQGTACLNPWNGKEHFWFLDKGSFAAPPGDAVTPQHPATCVTWDDAAAFAAWLAKKTGLPYRLPSEAEWEYAGRAGRPFSYADGDGDASLCRFAVFADASTEFGRVRHAPFSCSNTGGKLGTFPVGSRAPNAWGLHDMFGNAWEWVEDCWSDQLTAAVEKGHALTEPKDCEGKAMRGGSHMSPYWMLRSGTRYTQGRETRSNAIGFRVALTIED